MKTYTVKLKDIVRKWYLVDAEGKILGRLAAQIAKILRGKHKPIYSPHLDVGDHVVVINAEKIVVTGKKLEAKMYYRHSQYVGGLKTLSLQEMLQKHPEQVITEAVRGMLPHNKLGRQMIKKLHVHCGATHPHQAQNPEVLEL